MCPILAADFTSASNLGHAFGSKSIVAVGFRFALGFAAFRFDSLAMSQTSPRETLPDEYLCEIGRVAVEWTKAEADIEWIIWAFLFIDGKSVTSAWQKEQQGRAITTHINMLLRIDIMLSLARTCLAEAGAALNEVEEIAKVARELYPRRNKAVHGLWSPLGNAVFRQGYRARGDVSPFYDVLTLDDIKTVAAECIAFDERIKAFHPVLAETLFVQYHSERR